MSGFAATRSASRAENCRATDAKVAKEEAESAGGALSVHRDSASNPEEKKAVDQRVESNAGYARRSSTAALARLRPPRRVSHWALDRKVMTSAQRATLYRSTKSFLAYPTNQTDAGFFLASPPFVRIEEDTAIAVGEAVRRALSEYRSNVPTPGRDKFGAIAQPRLEAAGVRSEAAFIRGARVVSVVKSERFTVTPHVNGGTSGPKKGFQALDGMEISLASTADDEALGGACLRAIEQCR